VHIAEEYMEERTQIIVVVLVGVMLLAGCRNAEEKVITLATTTSTENSGLLGTLLPEFEKIGIKVKVMPMGTGQALRTAREGNCDVVLVHAPQAEQEFVDQGWGVNRRQIMYNDFVIAGPKEDPAKIRVMTRATDALKKISAVREIFVSRGDSSGTHKKEKELWSAASLEPSGKWYCSVGSGMGQTLTIAEEMRGYVLTDRATYIKFRTKISLEVMVQGDELLQNPYAIIAVNPQRHKHAKYELVMKFIEFLISDAGQKLIADYRLDGEVLFHPWPKGDIGSAIMTGSQES
jgi:tungstate transport system substrate-binding protein